MGHCRARLTRDDAKAAIRGMGVRLHAPLWASAVAAALLAALLATVLPTIGGEAMSLVDFGAVAQRTPGDDLFYLLPNPPSVVVSVDGSALSHAPAPGEAQALALAPGPHTLTWTSKTLPFAPLRCTVSVPHAASDTCPLVPQGTAASALAGRPGTIIGLHESLAALAPSDAAALTTAVAGALDAARSTTTLLPGESYFSGDGTGLLPGPLVAETPLRATLSLQYVASSVYAEPCSVDQPAIPCRFPGQSCTQLCTVASPPVALTPSANVWIAAALVRATWDYTLLDGAPAALGRTDAFSLQLAVLRITHDTAGWHVSALIGHIPGLDVADDAVCDTTRFLLDQTHTWHAFIQAPPSPTAITLAALPNPADGCVAILTSPGSKSPRAILLGRVGVLRMVSAQAASPADALPEADVPEQSLVAQGLAQLHL